MGVSHHHVVRGSKSHKRH